MLPNPLRVASSARVLRPTLACALGIVALGIADSGRAAGPGDAVKQATKLLKDSFDVNLKELRKALKEDRDLFDLVLDDVDAEVIAKTADIDDAFKVYSAATNIQIFERDHVLEAAARYKLDLQVVVNILEDAGITPAQWPKGFTYGDGGMLDDFHEDFEAEIHRGTNDLAKRLGKTADLFDQKLDIVICYRLEAPISFSDPLAHGGSTKTFIPQPLTIDVAMTASDRKLLGDGRVYLGGAIRSSDNSATLTRIDNVTGTTVLGNVTADVLDRWNYWDLAGYPEGNMSFQIKHTTKTAGAALVSIGIR